jgi:hypothetical protein
MTTIESEFDHLMHVRNDLLHGTWFIGYAGFEDSDSAEFFIRRFKTSKMGLKQVQGLPKNATALRDLADRCTEVRDWLGRVEQCFQRELKIADVFKNKSGRWCMDDPPGTMRTLPKK